ncbi:MAG TPA: hypothetical protein VHM70_30205 [Polyangiaceae bacterium]|nr:hypothetical protein [Polyangiaceae bacterium]
MASSKPSFPAPSEPNLRRLGRGGSTSDRPIRAQLVVAAVALLILVALPLYVLRRPTGDSSPVATAASATGKHALIRTALDAGAPKAEVKLTPVQRVKCSAAPFRQGNEGSLCDQLVQVEQAFGNAVKSTAECAPKTGTGGSINFVLSVDFSTKHVNVFPGQSGQWKGPQAKAAAKCVQSAMPELPWDAITHRYRYYTMALMATYPAPDPLGGAPEFE